jgi:hypothetical protein
MSDSNATLSTSKSLKEIVLLGAVYRGFYRQRDYNAGNRVRDITEGLIRTYVTTDVKEQDAWHHAQVNPILNRYEP